MIRTCLFLFGFLLSGIAALPSSIYTCARKNNSAARPLSIARSLLLLVWVRVSAAAGVITFTIFFSMNKFVKLCVCVCEYMRLNLREEKRGKKHLH